MCSVLPFTWGERRIYMYMFIKAQTFSERTHRKLCLWWVKGAWPEEEEWKDRNLFVPVSLNLSCICFTHSTKRQKNHKEVSLSPLFSSHVVECPTDTRLSFGVSQVKIWIHMLTERLPVGPLTSPKFSSLWHGGDDNYFKGCLGINENKEWKNAAGTPKTLSPNSSLHAGRDLLWLYDVLNHF